MIALSKGPAMNCLIEQLVKLTYNVLKNHYLCQKSSFSSITARRSRRSVNVYINTLKGDCRNSLTGKRKEDRFLDPPVFERKTMSHPHFEVAVYQSYYKRTHSLYHALAVCKEHRIAYRGFGFPDLVAKINIDLFKVLFYFQNPFWHFIISRG